MGDEVKAMLEKYRKKPSADGSAEGSIPNPIVEEEKKNKPLFKRPERKNELLDSEEGGWLTKAGDQISRGNYAPANLALEMYRGNVGTWQEAVAAHNDGFSLKKKTSWFNVVDEVFPEMHPWAKIGAGFAGDVILDEINFLPMGWFARVGKMLGIPKLFNIAGDIPAVDRVMKAFKPGHALSKVKSLNPDFKFADAYKHKRDLELQINYFRRTTLSEITERSDLFRKVAKSLGADPEEAAALMTKLHQAGQSLDIPTEYKPFYDRYAEGYKAIHKQEVAAGLTKSGTFRNNYFPGIYEKGRLIIKDGKITLGKKNGYFSKLSWKTQTPFSQGKKWETVDIAKKELAKIQAKGVATDIIPVEDWFKGYAIRKFVSDSAVAWKGYIDEAVDNFATPLSKHIDNAAGQNISKLIKSGDIDGAKTLLASVKMEKGVSFVTKTTNLRSPKMQSFALKETERALKMSKEADAVNTISNVFRKVEGKGLVDLNIDDIVKMGIDDVYIMPNEISKSVKNAFKPFSSDESVAGFMKGVDNCMYAWKSMATAMRVAFHPRNAMSNLWQMYLADVNPAMMANRLAAAGRVQLNSKSVVVNGFNAADLNKMGDRFGVKAYGLMGSDMPQSFQKELGVATSRGKLGRSLGLGEKKTTLAGKLASPVTVPFEMASRTGRQVGTYIEDNARLAVMIDQIKKTGLTKASLSELADLKKAKDKLAAFTKGIDPALAATHPKVIELTKKVDRLSETVNREREFSKIADHVKKYLYDYTEVTEFEKTVMGRALPFYKWIRKNTPRQIESLITRPEKFARLADFQRDLWPDTEKTKTEKAVMPEWMKKGGFRKTNLETAEGKSVFYKVDLPVEDLHNMMGLESYVGALNPILALGLTAVNVKLWPEGGNISKPGRLGKAPIWADFLPAPLKKLCNVKPINTPDGPRLGMSPQWKNALSTAFPFLKQWEIAYPTGTGKYVFDDDQKYQLLSNLTGVSFKPLDTRQAAKSKAYKKKEGIRNIKDAFKQRKLTKQEAADIFMETVGK